MKKILISLLSIGAVAVVAVAATGAFFSDTETSQDNTFVAGELDLKIDSACHYFQNGQEVTDGCVGFGNWSSTDLTNEKFFNFQDIKPGDYGENTISLFAEDNDQYVCAAIYNLNDEENTYLQNELDADDPGTDTGELSGVLNFFAWDDENGDNVWQATENKLFTNTSGPASDILNGVVYPLYTPLTLGVLTEGTTEHIGLYWCYGTIDASTAGVLVCDGSGVDNQSQTDSLTADMTFYSEQSRNNGLFVCPDIAFFQ